TYTHQRSTWRSGRSRGRLAPRAHDLLGVLAPALGEHLFGRLARLTLHARLGRPDELVDVGESDDPPCPAPGPVRDLERKDAHAKLRVGPGTPLGLGHGLGHTSRHRAAALVVVLALGDLAYEAVPRRLRWRAGDIHLGAVDAHPCKVSTHLVARVDPLVLEQQVGDLGYKLALGLAREGPLGYVCVKH